MEAVIVAVGTELLADRTDTNGPLLASRLAALGVTVTERRIVPDVPAVMEEALRDATARTRLVIVTGGLGPTDDDVTRDVVATLAGCALRHDPPSVARIEERARLRGAPPPNATTLRQALVPEGAEVLPNLVGAAPGSVLGVGQALVVLLPGPPSELGPMVEGALVSALRLLAARGLAAPTPLVVRRIRLAGVGEGAAFDRVAGLPELAPGGSEAAPLETAWLTRPGEVLLELRSRDGARVACAVAAVASAFGPLVVSTDDRSLAEVIVPVLEGRFETLAVAESCTAGLLGAEITTVPGSSAVFRGGVLAYADDVKQEILGVEPELLRAHGAVSVEVAAAMAVGARRVLRADWGLSVTGVAGPGGGTEEKPVGTVCFGVALPDGQVGTDLRLLSGGREAIRLASARIALDLLRRQILR